ncbi:MAG: FKBP-type peptidyl-prolyl cis-trans isomerase [Thermoplasmatales archaeon]|nr:FKBP-type peptidyl-prolyl cis-trans isomerase [Thermoplasmatales archaeon]
MTLFNPDMQREKLTAIGFSVIIIGALTVFLFMTYGGDILENLFGEEEIDTIEIGDCVDLNYIGRYAPNNSIFESSYAFVENKSGATPINVFVTHNATEFPPEGYDTYSSNIVTGLMEGLIGLKSGDTATIGPISPEKAYGVKPEIGDIVNLTSYIDTAYVLKIMDIQEDVSMPFDYVEFYGNGTTTLYVFREDWHYIGEIIENVYTYWDNSSVVTKINETLLWMYTTPSTEIGENFTWSEVNSETSNLFEYPTNTSSITLMNDTTIIVTHSPTVGSVIEESMLTQFGLMPAASYTVENVTADIINTSITDSTGNKTYTEFDRTITIQRNETQNITQPAYPGELLEDQLFSFLRMMDSDFSLSYNARAGETLFFEVTIEEVYKTSQS